MQSGQQAGQGERTLATKEGWSPAPKEDSLGCHGMGLGWGVWLGRWLMGESPVAIVYSCSLWGRVAGGNRADGQLGL